MTQITGAPRRRRRFKTPHGDRVRDALKKVEKWILTHDEENFVDPEFRRLVDEFEHLVEHCAEIDKEAKEAEKS